jgi:hypothetical protein
VQIAAPQVKKYLKDSPTTAGYGGTFLGDQCEDLGIVPVQIDDTPGAAPGTYHGANSLGVKRNVKAFHTLSVSWEVILLGPVCPHTRGNTTTSKVYPLQEADDRRKAEELLRNY